MSKIAKQPDAVVVRYDLHELPTAQHKAGLSGLLLQIDSMKERVDHRVLPADTPLAELVERGPTHATFRFTAASVQSLFDDLYAAKPERVWVDKKWKNAVVLGTRSVDDKETGRSRQQLQYEIVRPAGLFLQRFTDNGKEAWHRLWRETVWSTSRVKPTTLKKKFAATAAGKPAPDGRIVWKGLLLHDKASRRGGLASIRPDTAVLLAAQKENAERVEFLDRADHALLLHFWQLTARVFVPERIDGDGNRAFAGYVLAIPEVSDLPEFGRVYIQGLVSLDAKLRRFRPADAVIALAAQGSLEFMRHLMEIGERKAFKVMPSRYLNSVEFFHYIDRDAKGKRLRDPKVASHGRVPPREPLLVLYEGIRKSVHNPLMLAGRLRALLDGEPWFSALIDDVAQREWSWFIHSTKDGHRTPPAMIGFAWEAHKRFRELEERHLDMAEHQTKSPAAGDSVDRVVRRLVEDYVVQKARARLNIPESAPRHSEHTHRRLPGRDGGAERWVERDSFQEKRRDVATDLMLRLRSRHGDDFVEQFTIALGSVAQYLPPVDYELLAAALMRAFTDDPGEHRARTRDDVKSLTLLALSAASRSLIARSESAQTESGDAAGEESES